MFNMVFSGFDGGTFFTYLGADTSAHWTYRIEASQYQLKLWGKVAGSSTVLATAQVSLTLNSAVKTVVNNGTLGVFVDRLQVVRYESTIQKSAA